MSFPDSVVEQAWNRAGGRCECRKLSHSHGTGKCGNQLAYAIRGKDGPGRWEAQYKIRTGGDLLSNCEILCWNCFKRSQYEG